MIEKIISNSLVGEYVRDSISLVVPQNNFSFLGGNF